MTEDFLSALREAPRPEFADELKRRLDAIENEEAERRVTRPLWVRLRPAFAGVAALAFVAVALSVPAVRASARSLLEIFRIKRFAAVRVDPSRLDRLHDQSFDFKTLLSDQIETLEEPGEPQAASDVTAAAALAGFAILEPSHLPHDCALSEISVRGRGSVKATLDTEKLDLLARALDVGDLEIPAGLNGASVTIRTAPAVLLRYTRDKADFRLFQSRSPEITLPEGIDLPRLGAIGLQLAGMSAEEARLFAGKIDWRTTLLVPVPAIGGDFRDVEVGGAQGLLVTVLPPRQPSNGAAHPRPGWHSVLLWSKADRVFALEGPGGGIELLDMANSLTLAGS